MIIFTGNDIDCGMTMTRRHMTALIVAAVIVAASSPMVRAASNIMSAPDALAAAASGEVVLVDIRTRGEWKQSGLAEPALAISMHEAGFVRNLAKALGGDRSRPLALICAVGGRSAHMQRILATAGFTNVIDVSEGMFGSSAGPGWLKRGLPVKSWVQD
uniref:Putative sulfur transferase n=1 Tax=uncultured bacterium fosmid I5J7 TaxID=1701911 RepID=A0A1B0TH82_9BACT|nr:putative sulfur transferase [uncultured bacterium fosmid I5J7]